MKTGWWKVIKKDDGSWNLECSIEPSTVDLGHIFFRISKGDIEGEIV